ncbi:hypothetical protein [Luteibacter sp.]|jgi:hypothetical protein|uniref:hypothetical protein n=1 Tax=Luteibacter sp. TaxID=1886636 RepID=UPI002F3EE3C8
MGAVGLFARASPAETTQKEPELAYRGDPAVRATMNFRPVKWPLKFKEHSFGAFCYGTLTCTVWYAGQRHGRDKPRPSSSTLGPAYLDYMSGDHGGIRNFPKAAKATWTSSDGEPHQAEIDIASIFRDELIRHNVTRGEVAEQPDGGLPINPSIILEVNDRAIRVYMRAFIPTKHLQVPGNTFSGHRQDLILVKIYNY